MTDPESRRLSLRRRQHPSGTSIRWPGDSLRVLAAGQFWPCSGSSGLLPRCPGQNITPGHAPGAKGSSLWCGTSRAAQSHPHLLVEQRAQAMRGTHAGHVVGPHCIPGSSSELRGHKDEVTPPVVPAWFAPPAKCGPESSPGFWKSHLGQEQRGWISAAHLTLRQPPMAAPPSLARGRQPPGQPSPCNQECGSYLLCWGKLSPTRPTELLPTGPQGSCACRANTEQAPPM